MEAGGFYLKVPASLDLAGARKFGREILDPQSPSRDIPQYGELEGFISLENNQQTKLALRRHHWDEHYPAEIADFGREMDQVGIAIIQEVFSPVRYSRTLLGGSLRWICDRRGHRVSKLRALRYATA